MGNANLFLYAGALAAIACGGAILIGWLLSSCAWFKSERIRQEIGRSLEVHPFFYRLGGLLLATGFFTALFFDNRIAKDTDLLVLVIGLLLALILGLYDDWRPLNWSYQFLGQLLLGGILIFFGMKITHLDLGNDFIIHFDTVFPFLSSLVTLLWVLLVMNAMNWIDGADGLAGGVALVALVVLAWLSWQPPVNQPALVLLIMMALGAVIGFLCFNWYPAKLIAGSGGASFLGFLLAAFSVYAGAKVATALLVLAIPILDLFSVIFTRLQRGQSPFLPDKNHLHHILLSKGFSPRMVAGVYIFITSTMGVLALTTRSLEKVWIFMLAGSFFLLALIWIHWGTINKSK